MTNWVAATPPSDDATAVRERTATEVAAADRSTGVAHAPTARWCPEEATVEDGERWSWLYGREAS